jgi:thiamine kinase-like enzyme
MMQQLASDICQLFALDSPVSKLQAVIGGLLHHTWRLETTTGTFAVKELNQEIMSRPTARKNYMLSEQIAAAFQAEHTPAVAALRHNDNPLLEIDGKTVIVFPWIEGKTLPPTTAGPEYAQQIGMLLGRMHRLNLHTLGLQQPEMELIPLAQWEPLVQRAKEQQLSCAEELEAVLPHLLEWSTLSNQSAEILQRKLVVSHRDLDQKNVLWQDEHTPWLIDWEAAGLINPTFEAVSTALSWSGQTVGELDQATFFAFLQSYREAGAVLQVAGRDALHGCMGNWLHWLAYNLRRALGELTSEPDQQALGLHEVHNTLAILHSLSAHKDLWSQWIDEIS